MHQIRSRPCWKFILLIWFQATYYIMSTTHAQNMWNWALWPAAFDTKMWQAQKGTCKRQSSTFTSLKGERKCHTYAPALHDTFNLPTRPHLRVLLPLQTRFEPPPAEAPCLSNSRLVLHPSSATNEPASTLSKSSDDTDGGGAEEGGCRRLIFTLDSPSSPLDCRVYLPTQLASAEDRQTDRQIDDERVREGTEKVAAAAY